MVRPTSNRLFLNAQHDAAGAKCLTMDNWRLPQHYGSVAKEYQAVRENVGIFDLSYMAIVDVSGQDSTDYLRFILANDVERLTQPGRVLFSCILNEVGGVIDTAYVHFVEGNSYRLFLNGNNRDKDIAWFTRQSDGFKIQFEDHQDACLFAIQGPCALDRLKTLLGSEVHQAVAELSPWECVKVDHQLISYLSLTGETGFVIQVPHETAESFWEKALATNIQPCGQQALQILRVESGIQSYGAELDENTTPLEANLGPTVALLPSDREFIGRWALQADKQAGIMHRLVGLELSGEYTLLPGQTVRIAGSDEEGIITSGCFSPTLKQTVALARIPTQDVKSCEISINGTWHKAKIVQLPFLKDHRNCQRFS